MKIYVHVPFCKSKCAYCDFYSTPRTEFMEAYVEAVSNEYRHKNVDTPPDTLYFGGGTPSILPLPSLDRLVSIFRHDRLQEATIEANPDDITDEWTKHIHSSSPFNRVSMGIQSFDDNILQFIGRRHSSRQAIDAVDTLRRNHIDKISCDLIYGLPGQTLDGWKSDVDQLICLMPEHISAYLLSYEPRTRLGVLLSKDAVEEASDSLVEDMYRYLCEATRKAGYEHYEISNFALPGHRAVHNSSYWNGTSYLGLGPGAHSFVAGRRWYNSGDLAKYVASQGLGNQIMDEEDETNKFNDLLITRLRTSDGLNLSQVPDKYTKNFANISAKLLDTGELIKTSDGNLRIAEEKWLLSNQILLELIEV